MEALETAPIMASCPVVENRDIGRGEKNRGPAGSSAQQVSRLNDFSVGFSALVTTPGCPGLYNGRLVSKRPTT